MKRAQLARLEDQRGTEINFELPDFLKNKENLSAANKLRKMRANLSPISKSISAFPSPTTPTQEEPSSPSASLNERPQPAPRLSITNKNKTNISPMKIDEEDATVAAFENQANNNNALSLPLIDESADYANTKGGPPPLPPKPKVLPIKPSNWGVTTSSSNTNISSSVNIKPNSTNYTSTTANSTSNNNNVTTSSALQMPSKIPIDISRKHLGAEQTGRCAYLEEPSSSFV